MAMGLCRRLRTHDLEMLIIGPCSHTCRARVPSGPKWVTGGKTPSEYMLSELPQLTDIVRRVRRYSASPLVLRITAFWVQSQAGFWPNDVTRLSRIDWLWSAKRASVWVTGDIAWGESPDAFYVRPGFAAIGWA